MSNPRKFIIFKQHLDFDLGFERAMVAEYPHKDTPKDEHHIEVIEKSAYEALEEKLRVAVEALDFCSYEREKYSAAYQLTNGAKVAIEALAKIKGGSE